MVADFLNREVHASSRGLFVYFGCYRFYAPRKTKAIKGIIVRMANPYKRSFKNTCIYLDRELREFWRRPQSN